MRITRLYFQNRQMVLPECARPRAQQQSNCEIAINYRKPSILSSLLWPGTATLHILKTRPRPFIKMLLFVLWFVAARNGFALGQTQYVETAASRGSFPVCAVDSLAGICVDSNDFAGVIHAANNLQTDLGHVTGRTPALLFGGQNTGAKVILIGTIGKSAMIDALVRDKKIDASEIAGKWESFFIQTVPQPLPGIESALVICGSDQRGTIYGVYDLSEQIGVSPWHFWADVPPAHHAELFVRAGKFVQGPPAVKYRGIFINDEAPDLTGWVQEKFGGYNHAFYTNVFELLLRLKANYLWPAMWNNCFNADDPLNYELADEYGIVMGTSHVEPMIRADKEWSRAGFAANEWNFQTHSNELDKFWRDGLERNKSDENIITIAMRGKIDTPMSETANISLLEEIVAAQRKIIADVYQTNAAAVPQLWALYKEVQEYYEKGMRVPDDVTLLWCDDNWGNLRRLPSPEDRRRAGGSGIYYHFDYVGGPRNYKWVNSVSLPRVWEQMNLAHAYGANQIWIVNVGHLQHVQLPVEFFLSLAWNPDAWPGQKISEFTRLWAGREFGNELAPQIADVVDKFTRYNSRRKPELLSPDTFSLVNYQEADMVVADWQAVAAEADQINGELPEDKRDAFYELVLYPVKACANLNELYVAAAKNHLFAAQGRASANDWADEVKSCFQTDAGLSDYYNHTLAGGKWDHMMDQTHIGYRSWQQPSSNRMPAVVEVQLPDEAKMGVAVEGSTNVWPDFPDEAVLPAFDKFTRPSRFIDIFNGGKTPFNFSATTSAPWILLHSEGDSGMTASEVRKDQRLWVDVDWKTAPTGTTHGWVKIVSGTNSVSVSVPVFDPPLPSRDTLKGFVEAEGYVSIEAGHYTGKVDAKPARWEEIHGLGNTLSAMTIFPVTAPSVTPPAGSPCLEYKMYLLDSGKVQVTAILSPTLNFVAGRGLRFAVSFDDQPPRILTAVPADFSVGGGDGNRDWEHTVSDNVRKVKANLELPDAGEHTLKVWMVDPGVVLQKIVVDCGGVKPSYLGPPESFRR